MTDRELMQQALDLLDDINQCSLPPTGIPLPAEIDHVMEALRARLAQPEQEPVAWLYKKKDGMQVITDDPDYADGTWIPLYTAPPQRKWQGLTDEEIIDVLNADEGDAMKIARAIEAKLKEKNA